MLRKRPSGSARRGTILAADGEHAERRGPARSPGGLGIDVARLRDVLHGPQGLQRREEGDPRAPGRVRHRPGRDRHRLPHGLRFRAVHQRGARRSHRGATLDRLRHAAVSRGVRRVRRVERSDPVRRLVLRERLRPVHGLAGHHARHGGVDHAGEPRLGDGALGHLLPGRRHRRDGARRADAQSLRLALRVLRTGAGDRRGRAAGDGGAQARTVVAGPGRRRQRDPGRRRGRRTGRRPRRTGNPRRRPLGRGAPRLAQAGAARGADEPGVVVLRRQLLLHQVHPLQPAVLAAVLPGAAPGIRGGRRGVHVDGVRGRRHRRRDRDRRAVGSAAALLALAAGGDLARWAGRRADRLRAARRDQDSWSTCCASAPSARSCTVRTR